MATRGLAKVAAILIAVSAPCARADSLRCAGGIVQTGDAKIDVLAKCGRPSLVEDHLRERGTYDARSGVARRVSAPVDVWTYDFGPNRFVQVIRLAKGRVVAIERGSYGYADQQPWRDRPKKATCDPAVLSEGKLTLEILARCGEPAIRDEWEEEVTAVRQADGHVVATDTVYRTIALWTYDFGPNVFVRFVRIEDGWVTSVGTGSYGYGE